jgi:hypothetical protein
MRVTVILKTQSKNNPNMQQQQQQLQNKDKGEQQTLIITKNLDQQEGTSRQFEHRRST